MTTTRNVTERELTDETLDSREGEYDSAVAAHDLALKLRDLGADDSNYGLELYERRAMELINDAERRRAPQHNGQEMLFDEDAILRLGDGRSVRLGQVDDPTQLDRAHAVRTRQFAGQVTSHAAWTESYLKWREAMVATGRPLIEAVPFTLRPEK